MWFNTNTVFLTHGVATGGTELNAFDNAMRAARIADFNIIRVTSIVPPGVTTKLLKLDAPPIDGAGHMLPSVYETVITEKQGDVISAGVAVGVPAANSKNSGVIFL